MSLAESADGYHRHLPQANDRPGFIAMGVLFSVIVIAITGFRFYARRLNQAGYRTDDWLALAALITLLGLNATFIAGTAQGAITGHSQIGPKGPITSNLEHLVQKYKYAYQIIEKLTFGFIKLSLLFLWLRIFNTVKYFSFICYGMIALIVIWTLAFFWASIFQCGTDFYYNWAPIFVSLDHCTQINLVTAFVASDVGTDLIILLMPLPMIWRLQMNTKKKIGFTATFLVGLFTIGAGIGRMYVYLAINYDKVDNPDYIADFTLFLLWSTIEANVAMVVCCMPTLIPFMRKVRESLSYVSHRSSLARLLSSKSSRGKHSEQSGATGYSSRSDKATFAGKTDHSNGSFSHSSDDDDLEKQPTKPRDGIMVQKDLSSTYETR